MQDRFGNVYHDDNTHTPLCMQSNPCLYQPNIPNNYNYRHPMVPKANQMTQQQHQANLSSGSMPNLNGCAHSSASNATNMEHAAFCNNMMANATNSATAPVVHHQNHDHPLNVSAPIWNGQALNNQVAPGNRANNYWDNFRR